MLTLAISTAVVHWTGKWLGGVATRQGIRTAIAWAWAPLVVAAALWIPLLLIGGADAFTHDTPRLDANRFFGLGFFGIQIIQRVLMVWSFVLLCHFVAEAQGFKSAWMGLANVLIAAGLLAGPVMLVTRVLHFNPDWL